MRTSIVRLLIALLGLGWALGTAAQDRPVAHFVVNGTNCPGGVCSISLAEFGAGRPLLVSLGGALPEGMPLDIYMEQDPPQRAKGVVLEYEGRSVTPGRSALRIPASRVAPLWNGAKALALHLGDMTAARSGRLILHARLPNTTDDYASVSIELASLRTPNGELAWTNPSLVSPRTPTLIPIYPNPVKSGVVHIDLQGMPYGRRGRLSILNMLGTGVYSVPVRGGDLVECPSEGLSKGIYFIRVELEGMQTRTGRLVVDR